MIGIHQSQFLPWLPYFYKMFQSDVFVILDDVQFQKNGVQNRNLIKTPPGQLWLTVPVKHSFGAPINKLEIVSQDGMEKLLKTLEMNYRKSKYFERVLSSLEPVFRGDHKYLHSLNKSLLEAVLRLMGKSIDIIYSSDMGTKMKKDDLVIEIIGKTGQSAYLSGRGALDYMSMDKFKTNGIDVYVTEFAYEQYPQLWTERTGFSPDLSIVDLLFNNLNDAVTYINTHGSYNLYKEERVKYVK